MTDYDPRTATGIPTEPVGSLPRPSWLQQAYAQYDAGEITREQLEAEQDRAVKDSIEHLEQTGAPIISDGEQRWSSFATYAITDTLAGTGLADHLAGDGGQYFAIFADGHNRQLPRLTGGPFRYKTYAADTLRKSLPMAHTPMKQAVIAPSMLALLYPLDSARSPAIHASSSRKTWSTSARRTSGRPSRPARPGCPSTSPRGGWPPGTIRATLDRPGHAAALHRAEQPGHGPVQREERAGSACTPARAATGTRCTAPTCPTATCCRPCSASTRATS
jgi:Methionine synthase II (cobalamin-independent)